VTKARSKKRRRVKLFGGGADLRELRNIACASESAAGLSSIKANLARDPSAGASQILFGRCLQHSISKKQLRDHLATRS